MSSSKSFSIHKYPNKIIQCKLADLGFGMIVLPRDKLTSQLDDEINKKLNEHSIYFLINKQTKQIYIGRSNVRVNGESIRQRLLEHSRTKDFWDEAYIYSHHILEENITTIIESKLIDEFKDKLYSLINSINGGQTNSRPEDTKNISESHFERIKELMQILIYDIFWSKNSSEKYNDISKENDNLNCKIEQPENINKSNSCCYDNYSNYQMFYFHGKNLNAILKKVNNKEYWLLKGSQITKDIQSSMPKNVKESRKNHKDVIDENYTLTSDIKFTSSSAAASFVCGTSASGNEKWKDKNDHSPDKY